MFLPTKFNFVTERSSHSMSENPSVCVGLHFKRVLYEKTFLK